MPHDYSFDKRKFVIGGVAIAIIAMYIVRLFVLQLTSEDYRLRADSNAFRKEVLFPSRGLIRDRQGKLLVYNEPSYNIMVVMQDQHGIDTLDFCRTIGITREEYIARMEDIKDSKKHPNYSRNTPQLFMSQITPEEYSKIGEKLFRFQGFSIEKRTVRRYATGNAAHILGDVGEVNQADIDSDSYYKSGDYIGKLGVERSYEDILRGEKGMRVLLRDVHGRTQGRYQDGEKDVQPVAGRDITLSIDLELQALAERLLRGKLGAIVAIEPSTGEILCMASGPTYDPRDLTGRDRGQRHMELADDPRRPLLNRAIMGCYPPGSTFKPTQALIGLEEGIIERGTAFPCSRGFNYKGLHLGCHNHSSPSSIVPAMATSCNSYFCWELVRMFNNRQKFDSFSDAMTCWKDHLVSMGYGYKLGVDLPGERRGMIPNAEYYTDHLGKRWGPLSVVSISIGQGEVTATPLQIANLAATIANRGYFITPHVAHSIQGQRLDTLYTNRRYTDVHARHYNTVIDGMRAAVLGGTCTKAHIPGYEVCGKTGTAQNRGADHSVFMGFAPRNHPRIAVAVYVENGGFGATYGVPIGKLIMEQFLNGKLSPGGEQEAGALSRSGIKYDLKTPKEVLERRAAAARRDSIEALKRDSVRKVAEAKRDSIRRAAAAKAAAAKREAEAKKKGAKPTVKPAPKKEPAKPAAKPAPKKAPAKPAAKPASKKEPAKPAAKPAPKKAPAKPAAKPAPKKEQAKPAAKKAPAKPSAKPAAKPAAKKPAAKPAPKKEQAKPAAKKAPAKPAPQKEPAKQTPAAKPKKKVGTKPA